jgi:hypothetical protein
MHTLGMVALGIAVAALAPSRQGADANEVSIKGFARRTVYHSPQTPGFTSWAGLWAMPDKSVMLCFTQATGPVAGWRPRAPKPIRHRLTYRLVVARKKP